MTAEYPPLLRRVIAGDDLSREDAARVVGLAMDAAYSPAQIAGLLVAIAIKGESVDEITGAACAMRDRCVRVEHGLDMVADVVGTGGDGANTINISTMAALVVAAAGVPVAKHGNRAASSTCGSADVLEAAGLAIELAPDVAAAMLEETGFTFLYAPRYHPAIRHVGPVRRELGVRTIFNVLGPLTNPAGATHLVVGVAREQLLETMGNVLRGLGVRAGAVVHGSNGLDEIAGDAPTLVYSFDERSSRRWVLDPADYGIRVPLTEIVESSVDGCRAAFTSILGGERSGRSDVVALNAAVVLQAVGLESRLDRSLDRAREILASGAALHTFERAKEFARG
jgi:anthranilate phosphoribosyltransferase